MIFTGAFCILLLPSKDYSIFFLSKRQRSNPSLLHCFTIQHLLCTFSLVYWLFTCCWDLFFHICLILLKTWSQYIFYRWSILNKCLLFCMGIYFFLEVLYSFDIQVFYSYNIIFLLLFYFKCAFISNSFFQISVIISYYFHDWLRTEIFFYNPYIPKEPLFDAIKQPHSKFEVVHKNFIKIDKKTVLKLSLWLSQLCRASLCNDNGAGRDFIFKNGWLNLWIKTLIS